MCAGSGSAETACASGPSVDGLLVGADGRLLVRKCDHLLDRPFDRKVVSHQCGTVRMGNDPARAALDPYCRSFDHGNLFVVDAGYLPNSAAVNPSLTVAAQALRVADHIRRQELRS